jgi:hypothetical protein
VSDDAEKSCPSCGTGYQAWATRCADCDIALDGSEPAPAEREPVEDLDEADDAPALDDLRPLRTAPLQWLRRLQATLADDGVRSWILAEEQACTADHQHVKGCGLHIALWVGADDLPRALELDREHERSELPDLAPTTVSDDGCPACGEACPPEAVECPACGLAFTE